MIITTSWSHGRIDYQIYTRKTSHHVHVLPTSGENNINLLCLHIRQVLIYSKTYCPYCTKTKQLFQSQFPDVSVKIVELDTIPNGEEIQQVLLKISGQRTVPNVYVNKVNIGGNDDTHAAFRNGKLASFIAA